MIKLKWKSLTIFQKLLYLLMLVMVFEGLLRKLVPVAFGQPIFFLKDILCIATLYHIRNIKLVSVLKLLYIRWGILLLMLIPLLIYTAMLDIVLSIFATKQYMLYFILSLLVPVAFPANSAEQFKRFSFFFALLIFPTTFVAMYQNALPATHWLNLSVTGESLERFSAAGYLRVASTFTFTGQYCWFLNALCPFIMYQLFNPYINKRYQRLMMTISLSCLFIVGMFITGGRTAVYGCGGSLAIGFILVNVKVPSVGLSKGIIIGVVSIASMLVTRAVKPEFFAAYDKRAEGYDHRSNKQDEIGDRILDGFTDWNSWFWVQEPVVVLLGNGMGVMSNGADKVSAYAAIIRSTGFWTEGDTSTIAWEGGLYLLILWYGFRIMIIFVCFQLWRKIRDKEYSVPASFFLANVIISGSVNNIGMHPPLAIWCFLSVGCVVALSRFDEYSTNLKIKGNKHIILNYGSKNVDLHI